MDDEYNDLEEEMEELEEEIAEEAKPVKRVKKQVPKKKEVKAKPVEEGPKERYVPAFQKAKIGVVDTLTGEWVVDELSDLPTATLEALKLNKLDRIEIASGA